MITQLQLRNFKCFPVLDLPLAPLTLLCGLNGAGKSSVIQALLLLRQSFESGDLGVGRLLLGGPHVDLGTGQDVLCEEAQEDIVQVGIRQATAPPFAPSFHYSRLSNALEAVEWPHIPAGLRAVPPLGGRLIHVNAERVGPRKTYPLSESAARSGSLGANGEHAWNLLHDGGAPLDATDPRGSGTAIRQIESLTNHWLQVVSPGARLDFTEVPDADAVVGGFRFEREGDVPTRRYRTTHVGFGLSYVLPVIVGALAPVGSLCLVENPEAHLHPRGQTHLAQLCVRAALAGVQMIVETHSDHFMDGVRIAVRDGLIPPAEARFHYFARTGTVAVVTSPELDRDGRLSEWPTGFFDQHEENLAQLLTGGS